MRHAALLQQKLRTIATAIVPASPAGEAYVVSLQRYDVQPSLQRRLRTIAAAIVPHCAEQGRLKFGATALNLGHHSPHGCAILQPLLQDDRRLQI
jgi:hypothetical protein